MILSCKAILPLLHQTVPGFAVPAAGVVRAAGRSAATSASRSTPARGRTSRWCGTARIELETDGGYDTAASVYQQLAPMKAHDGRYPVVGSWVVNGWACGVGVREDDQIVTRNTSRFVPHKMDG